MHFSTPTLLAAAALIPSSMAHYCFNKLIVDGNYTGEYEYVRKNTNSNSPVTDVTSDDLRCNVGGLASGNTTSTYKLAAGASVGFGLDTGIGHPGPVQVYMSKVTDGSDASTYDGSGEWFKVHEIGVAEITDEGLQWATNGMQNFTFTLSDEVPAGQYLLRVESIALHGAETFGGAQFYISCAQIEVTSSSTATPSPEVKIPGVYTGHEPGIEIDIYWPIPTNYTMPGPAVWPSDGNSTTSTGSTNSTTTAAASSSVVVAASSSVAVASSSVAVASSSAVVSVSVSSAVAVSSSPVPASTTSVATQAAAVTSSAAPYPILSSNGTIPAGPTGFQTSTIPASPSAGSGSVSKKYGQCGGRNWTGATSCESGSTCTVMNDFYSQCV